MKSSSDCSSCPSRNLQPSQHQSDSHDKVPEEEEEILSKQALLIARGVAFPMVLKAAMELNVLEIISDAGHMAYLSAAEVAGRIPGLINPNAPGLLDRMMRLLTSFSILKCKQRGAVDNGNGIDNSVYSPVLPEMVYGLGPLAKYFRTEDLGLKGSFGPMFLLLHDKMLLESWFNLKDAVLEGGIPFIRAHGMSCFEYMGKDQRFNSLFNQAMFNHTVFVSQRLLDSYKGFDDVEVLVDVGGGIGGNLSTITSTYPAMKGINFDLPHVVAKAPLYPNVEHVGGNMFESVPSGNAILMKWILHDWDDDSCLKLLKNCWKALPMYGKVIVIESILPPEPLHELDFEITCELDMTMMAHMMEGRERTQEEFESLAMKSGFSEFQVVCSTCDTWVMEFRKFS